MGLIEEKWEWVEHSGAATILGKPVTRELRESERSAGAEGSSCFPSPVGRLEKEQAFSALCTETRNDRLNVQGIPQQSGRP